MKCNNYTVFPYMGRPEACRTNQTLVNTAPFGRGSVTLAVFSAAFLIPVYAQPRLYACASFTKEYVVGAKLPASGLFRRAAGGWEHVGFNHPFLFNFEADAASLLLAAGNGLIRAPRQDGQWTILTGSDVTELRDVAVDHGIIYFAYTLGVRSTHDHGKTWRDLGGSFPRKYTETIRVDSSHRGVLIAGTEEGIYRSEDDGNTWRLSGGASFQIMRIEQSPHDACFWLATTQQGGLFASHDCGRTFESAGALGVGRNLYDVAFDPTTPGRIAVAGWGPGVVVSRDDGKTWQMRNAGLPSTEATSVAFDPGKADRLFAAVHEEAVYVSQDGGGTWTKDGLEGAHVSRLRFVGESAH